MKKIIIFFFCIISINSCFGQNKSDQKQTLNFKIPASMYILNSATLNWKDQVFKILALEKKVNDKENAQHNSLLIIILKKFNNEFIEAKSNKNIVFKYDYNCPADGFQKIVVKNNYFTIEQVYCKDFLFVNSYTTFRFDEKTKEIVMHKYSEAYTDRSNPYKLIPNKIKTIKDFGKIQFEAITQELLIKLVK
ncbi:hypothetical protein [Flavobacterium sp. 5]|uniref:hypothetical protein n=1 Tax=Flavobacterium sp. 5 TaxID=2035199 RepID=UPI000C2C56DA|nr:hypothetical protein [Flavobacterium sp. 5]PKB18727.1 hypothetical protein CLU82_4020 [Flavobacterium sp. 5]